MGVGRVIEGKVSGVSEGIVIGVNDVCVKDIGVSDSGVNDMGVKDSDVNDTGVNVNDDSAGTAPPEPNSLQLRVLQQPCTPLRITQWSPGSQYSPPVQHSLPSGAQEKGPQHLRPSSQAPPLAQQVCPSVTHVPSSQHWPLPP